MKLSRIPHAVLTALVLCSCSSAGITGSSGAARPAPASGAPRMTQLAVNAKDRSLLRRGGTLNWAIDQLSTQWNPVQADGSESSTNDVMKALLPTFWRSDAGGTQTPNKAYLLDVRAETRQGKQVVTWTLNPQAHWSDGKQLSWRDIEATWRAQNGRNKAFKPASTTGFDQVESVVRGQDDQEAVMTFSSPFSEWQSMFNNAANAPLLPADYISTPELFNTSFSGRIPVTAGPFKLEGIDRTARTVTVVADPAWWGDHPMLDRIVFRAMDTSAMSAAFAKGEIDFFNNGPNAAGYKQIQGTPTGEVRRAGGPNLRQLLLNGKSPQLADAKVRQAVFQAIDRELITRTDLNGLDWPYTPMNNHFLVPNQNGYRDNSAGLSRYDPQAASETLDAAGWKLDGKLRHKDGRDLALRFVVPTGNALAANESTLVTQMLSRVGIKVTVTPVPAGDFFEGYVYKHDFDMTAFALLGTPFPATSSTSNFQQGAGSNYSGVGSDALDGAMAEAAVASSAETEDEAINRADVEAWLVAGMVPLYQRPAIYGVRKAVANLGAPGLSDFIYENIGFLK